jgi:plastocyanin
LPGRPRCLGLAAGVAALSLAFPVAAQAKVKTVYEGLPISEQSKFLNTVGANGATLQADAIDYFPHTVTIHVGDSVKFEPTAFRNIDIPALKHGKQQKPLTLLQTSLPAFVTGDVDAAGQPFWFNGQRPNVFFNPAVVPPHPSVDYSFTKKPGKTVKVTYTGKKEITSDIPFNAGPPSTQVKFTRAGTYTVYDDLHEGLNGNGAKGVVRVLPKHKKIPSAAADKQALAKQVARDFKIAKGLQEVTVPPNTVDVGSAGDHGVEYFGYLPSTLTVPVHTTVTFAMTSKSFENHTATIAAAQNADPEAGTNSHLGKIAASFFQPTLDPEGVWQSDPTEPASETLTAHGDGFWNSGVLAPTSRSPVPAWIPQSRKVTFDQPGRYEVYCMVHPQMHGTVVVSG